MKFTFSGGKELEKALGELSSRVTARNTAERALKLAATPIRDDWERRVPVDEGDLKRSIKIGKAIKSFQRKSRGDLVLTFVGVDESQDKRLHIYAKAVEFGEGNSPAQPAGRPAWESQKQNAVNRLADDLRSEIEKTKARAARKAARKAKQ